MNLKSEGYFKPELLTELISSYSKRSVLSPLSLATDVNDMIIGASGL